MLKEEKNKAGYTAIQSRMVGQEQYSAAQKKVLGSIKSYFIAIDITF